MHDKTDGEVVGKLSEKFERLIARIHELIEKPGTQITWNDHIPDPDNPNQLRQIDITIRNQESVTHVECRIHKERQDVQWIEELIGRRVSLQADMLIAVSASGFTRGAIAKSEAHGIVLRDLLTLTEEEVREWGKRTTVWVKYYEYQEVGIKFVFPVGNQTMITYQQVQNALLSGPVWSYGIFEDIAKKLDACEQDLAGGKQIQITARLNEPLNVQIENITPEAIDFTAKVRVKKDEFAAPAVHVYGHPTLGLLERNIFVEKFDMGEFELRHAGNDMSLTIDLGQLQIPLNCQYRSVDFLMSKSGRLEMKGLRIPNMSIALADVWVGIDFE